jgi:hypothetical protein
VHEAGTRKMARDHFFCPGTGDDSLPSSVCLWKEEMDCSLLDPIGLAIFFFIATWIFIYTSNAALYTTTSKY